MKVMKFGGGCLQDAACFSKVAEIIRSERERAVVVTSAMYGITDFLEEGIRLAVESESSIPVFIESIKNKHMQMAESLIKDKNQMSSLSDSVSLRTEKLKRLLYGVSFTEEVSGSIRAHILSFGERLSVLILSALLNSRGKRSLPLCSDEIGMITDGFFERATAVLPEIEKRCLKTVVPKLNQGFTPVITGFFGRTKEGKITTFGRNGSDYSAAVLAHCLDAGCLEIWKDVNGFMTADPRIFEHAQRILRLSYYEAAELSYFGARILYPRTVEPLIEKGISIHIKNFHLPEQEGTVVSDGTSRSTEIVKSITYNDKISMIRIHGPGVGFKPGILGDVGHSLAGGGINIYSVFTSQTCINLLVDRSDSDKSFSCLKGLEGGIIEKVSLEEDVALVAVVGIGLLEEWGVAARIFSAVAREKINIKVISCGASEVACYFIVDRKDLIESVKAVHHEFFPEMQH